MFVHELLPYAIKDGLYGFVTYPSLLIFILVVAEALYFRANLLNKEGKYDLSNDVISQISISTNQSSVWNAKSLLLLAKNYYLLNDPFQAIFVLDSLIENFKTYDQIVSEAQLLKTKFKDSLKNKNQNDDA